MNRVFYIISFFILSFSLFSKEPWDIAVNSYPKYYVFGSVLVKEEVINNSGELEESSLYTTKVDYNGYINLISIKYNNEILSKRELQNMEVEVNKNCSELDFDPFDPGEQKYIKYKNIISSGTKTYYIFEYQRDGFVIEGDVILTSDGIPLSCNYEVSSLPIIREEYTILELAVKNSYKKG